MMTFLFIAHVLSSMIVAAMAVRSITTIAVDKRIHVYAAWFRPATKGDIIFRIIGWAFIALVPPFNIVFAFVEILDIIRQFLSKTRFAKWWKLSCEYNTE